MFRVKIFQKFCAQVLLVNLLPHLLLSGCSHDSPFLSMKEGEVGRVYHEDGSNNEMSTDHVIPTNRISKIEGGKIKMGKTLDLLVS